MNKLEVGMYVRTDNGNIRKITELINSKYIDDPDYYVDKVLIDIVQEENTIYMEKWLFDENIIKSSHNIIDLIEVGDIITYEYPMALGIVTHENITVLQELLDILKNGENNNEYKIKSIVTKEQFEQMKYEVK